MFQTASLYEAELYEMIEEQSIGFLFLSLILGLYQLDISIFAMHCLIVPRTSEELSLGFAGQPVDVAARNAGFTNLLVCNSILTTLDLAIGQEVLTHVPFVINLLYVEWSNLFVCLHADD